jgi:4-hydroxy 2-oxovalerate aldolase
LDLSNELGPYAMYMVDSLGVMRGRDLINLYGRYEKTLNNDIYIGFHSHNNLQLSFSNAQELIECSDERKIIIDSTLMGIGRGAGNLCTELITQQLNEKNGGEYDLLPILTTLDEVLYPLQSKYQWGYTIPYYLAATCRCHPNYATYLSNKQTLRVKDMSALLKLVPDDSKSTYDQKLIDKIYVDFQSNIIDDSNAVKAICESIDDRDVIVVAPGKSYKDYLNRINQRALSECSFIISVNFIDSALNADMVFFGNNKRYSEYQDSIKHFNGKIVISSNIKDNVNADFVLNYADYLNNDPDIIDNSGLMLMNLLYNIGIKRIGLAGFDGFHLNQRMDYYDESRKVAERESIQNQNKSISIKIRQLSTKIEIDFITPSLYEKIDSDKFEI